jgi:hypothetical protein
MELAAARSLTDLPGNFKSGITQVKGYDESGHEAGLPIGNLEKLYALLGNCAGKKSITERAQVTLEGWKCSKSEDPSNPEHPLAGSYTHDFHEPRGRAFALCGHVNIESLRTGERYVKLKKKDVLSLCGDIHTSIYLLDRMVKEWIESPETGVFTDKKTFYGRNEEGIPISITKADGFGTDSASWVKRHGDAIKSIESDRGWSRFLDPRIELYLVAISAHFEEDLNQHVAELMRKNDAEAVKRLSFSQTPKVIASSNIEHVLPVGDVVKIKAHNKILVKACTVSCKVPKTLFT